MKKELNNITLFCLDCYNYGKAVSALQNSLQQIIPARTVFLTDIDIEVDGVEIIKIPTISSKEAYSEFMIKELNNYFDTDFVMVVQHDGYVISGKAWNDEFYEYDFIGAPWLYVDGKNVGCGGASLRSKRLQKILAEDTFIKATDPEDQAIGRLYRDYLIKEYGIKFPSEQLADTFAYELREPICDTFAFHGYFHNAYKPTVILRRSAAIGDIIMLEPIMRWYFKNNYNVVLDIPVQFFDLFSQHYFPVKHISRHDSRIPAKEINLDGAYESKPHQLYQKTYAEYCGIKDYIPSRPILSPMVDGKTKIFRKYAVIHLDERETNHRNIYGVDWNEVRLYLESKGYFVVQVGLFKHETVAIEFNTQSIGLLKFLIAGSDLFLGTDSACSHIAVSYNKPSLIFFGSVNKNYIHPDLTNIETIENTCEFAGCWHTKSGSVRGIDCVFDKEQPPCCVHDSKTVIKKLEKLIDG